MKREKLLILGLLISFLFACEEKENIDNENDNSNLLQTGEVRIKAYSENNKISFQAITQKIIIDWGDGSKDELYPNGILREFVHEYTNQNLQNITISTDGLKFIGKIENVEMQGKFQELRIGNCPVLQKIIFPNQELTVFEIEKSDSLNFVDCSCNKLSDLMLNKLFASLPIVSEGFISYKNNIGSGTCDIGIANSKGWKEYISEEPPNVITIDDFFQNEEDVKKAVAGTFTYFADFIKQYYLFEALYSNVIDLDENQGYFYTYRDILNHTLTPTNTQIRDLWTNAYRAIRSQNLLLDKLTKIYKEKYSNYIHTMSVLRVYTYFTLINCWGNVPFVDEQNYDNMDLISRIRRTPEEQILSVLVNDMLNAEKILPNTEVINGSICFSKSFAQLLLAKIYTYQKNYSKALEYTTKIIESGHFSLSSNTIDIYENNSNEELITKLLTTYVEYGNSQNQNWITLIQKGRYLPFARYAEVILLASENNLRIGNANNATYFLNLLRKRNNRSLLNNNETKEIENAILDEYKQDLGKEGVYFFALKRLDKAKMVLNIESYKELFPIPMNDIMSNPNITQNEGY